MTRQNWYVGQILTVLLFTLVLTPFFTQSGLAQGFVQTDADKLSPSEIHKQLAARKAESLLRSRQMVALAAAEEKDITAQTNYDVTFYDIWMRVNDTAEVLYGKVTFEAKAAENGVSSVEVDLYSNMTIDSIVAPSGTLSYTRSGNKVTVNLGQSYNLDEPFDFDFWYHGTPVAGGFQAFEFGSHNGDPAITTLSEPYFARTWWPCKDRMDDKPDSMRTHIEVDTSLYCASNGTLDSITTAAPNSRTFHYTMSYPMATYLFSLAIHPYVVWSQEYVYNGGADTMPIIHHVYPDYDSYSRPRWGLTPDIMAALAQNFGEYPFVDHKYGHANFNWGGGMEHQTVTSMIGSSFGFNVNVVAHEMAHQWWGDMITCKSWQDIWLNEGWASYAEAVYHQATEGWSSYFSYMNGMAYYGAGTVIVEPSDTNSVNAIFNGSLSYDKGAWVVHMLRGVLKDSLFFRGVEAYYNSEFKYSAATTEDFKNVFEAATGQELDWFFDEWIYGQYYPKYEYSFLTEATDTTGYDTYIVIKQVQTTNPRVFHMPIDVFINYASITDDTVTIKCDGALTKYKLNAASSVSSITLDPLGWILKSASSRTWTFYIISFPEDISDGLQNSAYVDTVEARGGVGGYTASITGGALPPGLNINNSGIISGIPTDTGMFTFEVTMSNPGTGLSDVGEYSIHIVPGASCCIGMRGNIDNSPDDAVSLGDLTALIDHMFITLSPLACPEEGNLDLSADGEASLADLTRLIDFLFISFDPLPPCP